ncbi:hypothetical protein [Pseudomonas sp. N2-11]|uniref:hypothetical protein n=1 Tax=Pseudomonas sp. N2-11 TaxID=2962038 RepID=UPI0020B89A1F|nr:hypothetical protein [Pseudomonas sp. N2-11]MCP3791620.1 hypothetical protein [Pseudomonas sp. N2-11]
MTDYIYHPELSFLARCWWQLTDELIQPDRWWDYQDKLAPMWLHVGGAGIHNDHWYNYWRAEPEGKGPLQLAPEDYTKDGHRYGELFWFGAYVAASGEDGAKLCYEIRPYDSGWRPLNRILYNNPSTVSGYVAVKRENEPSAGQPRLSNPTHLWSVQAMNYAGIKRGARTCNLILENAQGHRVRRYKEADASLINTVRGEPGRIALEILDYGHQAREWAWGTALEKARARYRFQPQYSFIGRAWWRPDGESTAGGLVTARFDEGSEWSPRAGLVVETNDFFGNRWNIAEFRMACDHFWFAAYSDGNSHVYELWPLDSHGRRLDFTLREQRGWTTSLAKRWTSQRALPDFLWKLEGLDPKTLDEGTSVLNVQLQHLSGGPATLLWPQHGRRLITGQQGQHGSLTIHVLETAARC